MARRRPRSGWGEYAYRIYAAAYFAVLGFALLGDLSGHRTTPLAITPRASALAGLAAGVAILAMGLSGYRAVAIRPTPAEIQFDILSPVPRRRTLTRPTAFSATSAAIGGAVLMLITMLTSPKQFGGLTVGRQVGYLAFAAGTAVAGFAAHLIVAERARRSVLVTLVLAALGLSAYDAISGHEVAPLTVAIEWLRDGPALVTIVGVWALGIAGIVTATRRAERLPVELIARGADVLDKATFALAGNDFRSLLLLQRSITNAWRDRPLIRFSSSLARRFPVTIRALRGLARWRYGRVFVLVASALGSATMLADEPTIRTLALAAAALWVLGLVLAEPFAQENDRRGRADVAAGSGWGRDAAHDREPRARIRRDGRRARRGRRTRRRPADRRRLCRRLWRDECVDHHVPQALADGVGAHGRRGPDRTWRSHHGHADGVAGHRGLAWCREPARRRAGDRRRTTGRRCFRHHLFLGRTSEAAVTTVRFDHVTKQFYERYAVKDLSIEIPPGTWCLVLGPNGSGKTTLLSLAAGLQEPTEGKVHIGAHIAGSRDAREEVAYFSDSPAFYSDLSVAEHIDYLAGLYESDEVADRAVELVDVFGLSSRADDLPSSFSRGMKQKTALALSLARPASVFLLDEPTRGLDVKGTETLVALLTEYHATGASIITITHEPERFTGVPGLRIEAHEGQFSHHSA